MVDLISRRAAIKAIDDLPNCYNGYSDTYDKAYIIGVLEEVPTIEPKKGKWIEPSREVGLSYDKKAFAECSVCGKKEFLGWDKAYCPNCGAKMEGSEE